MRTAGGWGWCVANMAFPGLNAAVLVSMSVGMYAETVCIARSRRPYLVAKDELAGDRWRLWNLHGIDQSPDLKREFMVDSICPKGSTQEFFTDTRESAPSRIAIYRRVPSANNRKVLSCPGSHQGRWPCRRGYRQVPFQYQPGMCAECPVTRLPGTAREKEGTKG